METGPKPALPAFGLALRWLACASVVALFCWSVARYRVPDMGFTSLVEFGSRQHPRYIPELKSTFHYEERNSYGYDAQWYAQMAMHPRLGDPVLGAAVDSLPYRARRILFPWIAWVAGAGDPAGALDVFSLLNVACWFLLAGLLFRLLPPVSWGNCLRWACVLFSFGLIFSVRASLLDGPSLLLIAIGVALVESGRPWRAALVMGVSGLGRETNVLAAASLGGPRSARGWGPWIARWALVLLPLALWAACLRLWLGSSAGAGTGNFSVPFAGAFHKVASVLGSGNLLGSPVRFDALALIGLLAQFCFFAFRIRWREAWWRLGAGYAVLLAFLGDSVWEGYPSAAPRVLLPMTLAFNLLVPRKGWWALLLVAGNLGVLGSVELLKPLEFRDFVLKGPVSARVGPDGIGAEAAYTSENWWPLEREGVDFWHWSKGDCTVTIHNPQPFALRADVSFGLATGDPRGASVSIRGAVVWSAAVEPAKDNEAVVRDIELPPGDTVLLFRSDRPATRPGAGDARTLTFSVRDLTIDLRARR